MKIYNAIPSDLPPTALTIGTFDGVHLGHQTLLNHLSTLNAFRVVLTFSNHPLETLAPEKAPKLLTPLPEKLALLQAFPLDAIIVLPFTKAFASLSYEELLDQFPLTHLLLGEGEAFGKNREGTPEKIGLLAQKKGFLVTYIPKRIVDGAVVSSRRIRKAIEAKDFEQAERLLGRSLIEKGSL